jgi:hypothetical protein
MLVNVYQLTQRNIQENLDIQITVILVALICGTDSIRNRIMCQELVNLIS